MRRAVWALVCLLWTTPAGAKKAEGWRFAGDLGLQLSLSQNDNVPGVDDGVAMTMGISLKADVLYRRDAHEWSLNASLQYSLTKSPTLDPFVKANDELQLKTAYTFHFPGPLGAGLLAGMGLRCPLFPTTLVLTKDKSLSFSSPEGQVEFEQVPWVRGLPRLLADPYLPLVLEWSAGGKLHPVESAFVDLQATLAASAQYVYAEGWSLQDDPTTAVVELRAMRPSLQVGILFGISAAGRFEKRLVYQIALDLMMPFFTSVPTSLSGLELLNGSLKLSLELQILPWLAVRYNFRAQRTPLIAEQWQIDSNFQLVFKLQLPTPATHMPER